MIIDNYDLVIGFIKNIERGLPEVEGVTWKVYIDRECDRLGHCVRVLAEFHTDGDDISKSSAEIRHKVNQIVSKGQVLLELEK